MLFGLAVLCLCGIADEVLADFLHSSIQDRVNSVSVKLRFSVLRDSFAVCVEDVVSRLDYVYFGLRAEKLGELRRPLAIFRSSLMSCVRSLHG